MPHDTRQTKISSFFTPNLPSPDDGQGSSYHGLANPVEAGKVSIQADGLSTRHATPDIGGPEQRQNGSTTGRQLRAEITIIGNSNGSSSPTTSADASLLATDSQFLSGNPTLKSSTQSNIHADTQLPPEDQTPKASNDSMPIHDTISLPNPSSSAPSRPFTISLIDLSSIPSFKRLLTTLLPIAYRPTFFSSISETNSAFSRQARWPNSTHSSTASNVNSSSSAQFPQSPLVGGIKCRLDPLPTPPLSDGTKVRRSQLYIQAIGVLAPYRRFGIAEALLDEVLKEAKALEGTVEGMEMGKVVSVYAHVWEKNEEALEWYRNRAFEVEGKEDEYYTKLRPRGAWVIRRTIV